MLQSNFMCVKLIKNIFTYEMYTDVNVNISDNQKQKVKKALEARTQLSLRLSREDLVDRGRKRKWNY